jgi:hypothetical protein
VVFTGACAAGKPFAGFCGVWALAETPAIASEIAASPSALFTL